MRPINLSHEWSTKGLPLFGLLQLEPDPTLAEDMRELGYDFLFLDGEHGHFTLSEFQESLATLARTHVLSFLRVPSHDLDALRRYFAMGADAILVPHVSTVAEAASLVKARSSGSASALIVILESRLGAENAEAILSLEGVAGAFVGPNDLSADVGTKGDFGHPAYLTALLRIEQAAASTGKLLGSIPHPGQPLEALLARGHRILILGIERRIDRNSRRELIRHARALSADGHTALS